MPPKKATTGATKKATASHASYRDMIKDAILNLKERNGSSRQSIKKYVLANNKITVTSQAAFDSQFNKAIKAGAEKGEFTQPKGPSGPVKLAKKEPAKPAAKPAPAKKSTTKPAPKKTAVKKTEKPKTATKKAPTKKTTAKANTAKPRKASTAAPAVVDQPKVLGKTKSGRVTKTTAKPPAEKKAVKKRATPKKTEA
jgi:histone H1/5